MAARVEVASLEIPVVLVAPGLGATEAVLEELDPNGDCRLRSLRFFSPRTKIRFGLGSGAEDRIHLGGSIVAYATKGQRFIYDVELERGDDRAEWILAVVAQRRRQLATGRSGDPLADGVHSPPLARSSVRSEANFRVEYRIGGTWREATAANLSVGGLLMRARETLLEGMAVELRFTLPPAILERCSDDALLRKLWDRAVREAAQAMLRRPFKELTLRARVVCHRAIANTIGDYGMEFCNVDPLACAEIERYCAALHVARQAETLAD
jgi:hypothetical protein